MKLTFLILSAAVCYSVCADSAVDGANYSLWPQRPPQIAQAARLLQEGDADKAVDLLRPFVRQEGVIGREARKMTASVNVAKYLSRSNPTAYIYTVRSGDTLPRIVVNTKCNSEVLMLLNGIVDPSSLRAGARLVAVNMKLRAEVHVARREVCVWDSDTLVAVYDVESMDLPDHTISQECTVSAREGYIDNNLLGRTSLQLLAAERVVRLSNGVSITGTQAVNAPFVQLKAADVNELALLLSLGSEVSVIGEGAQPLPDDSCEV